MPSARTRRLAGALAVAFGLAPIRVALANDEAAPAPTEAQVTERTDALLSLWDSLRRDAAGLRLGFDEELVSAGKLGGARTWWLRTGLSAAGGIALGHGINVGISPGFAWERLVIDGPDTFNLSRTGRRSDFTDFYESSLRLGADYEFDETWGAEILTGFSARHEQSADYGEALQWGGSVALTYRRGRFVTARLGLGLGADLSDRKLRLSPVYRIRLRPTPRLTLETSGLTGGVQWQATREATLGLAGGVDNTQYKLDRRPPPPQGPGDGTLQRRQARIDAEVVYRLGHGLRLRGRVGTVLDQELSIRDEDGFEVDRRRDRDPSLVLSFGVELRL
ncbi:MAG: hypothetical protein H6748_09165 [Spirochaetaceae bacterium]|nr:hypothetical protein [Myxococcales bacterium]MCB9724201.1 hypothetical protein [Spirochaetaceae bacterium]